MSGPRGSKKRISVINLAGGPPTRSTDMSGLARLVVLAAVAGACSNAASPPRPGPVGTGGDEPDPGWSGGSSGSPAGTGGSKGGAVRDAAPDPVSTGGTAGEVPDAAVVPADGGSTDATVVAPADGGADG